MNQITAAQQPADAHAPRTLSFEFRGDGTEFFKIWIVNILLSIITLGIYSAWAKVRTNRYFYSNLYLDNSNFRYLAEPLSILKGRLIAVAAFIAYTVLSNTMPMVGLGMLVLLLLGIPYFINQSIAFNMRMSAYKNIQFRFKGTYWKAFMVFYIWPILGMLSLGILYPMAILKANQYIVRNSAYGTTNFDFSASYRDYGLIFLTALGVGIVCGLPIWALATFAPSLAVITPIAMGLVYFGLIVYFLVAAQNLYYRCLSIEGHRFEASLTIPGMAKVILINAFLTLITLGLYLPAAKVRMTKYLSSNIVLHASGSLDHFAAAEQENISALGEEFGQVFDFAG